MSMRRNYNDPEYARFRKEVLKRDKGKCRMPNCKSRKNIEVHHIQTWSHAHTLRYEVSNGITLCRSCHKSITGKECHYVPLFMEIINGL